MRRLKVASVVGTLAVIGAAIGGAQAATILKVHYAGKTSQTYAGQPSPSIAIDIDQTHHSVYYIGIAYQCTSSQTKWIFRTHPTAAHGKINKKGDFKYVVSNKKLDMAWISGHVTNAKITGKFDASRHSCNTRGTYVVTRGGK